MLKVSVDEENARLKHQLADERAENTRLAEEVQARTAEVQVRTRELTESLEYQTATSDVLAVISVRRHKVSLYSLQLQRARSGSVTPCGAPWCAMTAS